MPPSEYAFLLQKGITGGFAPPTPVYIHTFTKSSTSSTLLLSSTTSSQSQSQPFSIQSTPANDALIDELRGILQKLPMESPPGSEDIYGMDVSIAWGSEDLEWCNGGMQGCGGGSSDVKPTEEEKRMFARAVEIVNELVGSSNLE